MKKSKSEEFKDVMKTFNITYAQLSEKVGRVPETVKQRLNTESTFNKHLNEYRESLLECIEEQEKGKKDALERLRKL